MSYFQGPKEVFHGPGSGGWVIVFSSHPQHLFSLSSFSRFLAQACRRRIIFNHTQPPSLSLLTHLSHPVTKFCQFCHQNLPANNLVVSLPTTTAPLQALLITQPNLWNSFLTSHLPASTSEKDAYLPMSLLAHKPRAASRGLAARPLPPQALRWPSFTTLSVPPTPEPHQTTSQTPWAFPSLWLLFSVWKALSQPKSFRGIPT